MGNIFIFSLTLLSTVFASIKFDAQVIYNFAGTNAGNGCSGDGGQANLAMVGNINGIATDNFGNVYFTDRFTIRKVNASGIISTIGSSCSSWTGYIGDGGLATQAAFDGPDGIILDALSNIYIADANNYCIRKINTSGIVTTIAGNGNPGYSGDGGQAIQALIGRPSGITVDPSGNIYFTDLTNNCIRKIDNTGIITTIAGTGISGFSGDGGSAVTAQLKSPGAIVIDAAGNLYFTDIGNYRIRKINTSGIISTVAGNGTNGYSGDGAAATTANIFAISLAIDTQGNFYISDSQSNRIRKVNTLGIINTVIGNGTAGNSGDGGPPLSAQISMPTGIAVSPSGDIYFGQIAPGPYPSNIRVVCQNNCLAGLNFLSVKEDQISVYPNPSKASFKLNINSDIQNGKLIIINSIGQKVYEEHIIRGVNRIKTNDFVSGLYNYILFDGEQQVYYGKLSFD